MVKQDQKTVFLMGVKNSRGQAAVEYVLLLIVAVGLIMGAGKVFKSIDKGLQSYVGDYFICLMEYGELPTLGVQDANLKKHTGGTGKTCDSKFEAFSLEDGRPPTGGGSGSTGSSSNSSNSRSGGSGADGGQGEGSNSDSSNAKKNGSGSDSDSANGSGGPDGFSRGGSSGSSSRSGSRGGSGRNSTAYATLDGGLGAEESKTQIIEDPNGGAGRNRNDRRRPRVTNSIDRPPPYRAITGRMAQEIEKQQKRRSTPRKPTSTVLASNAEEGSFLIRSKVITPPPDREIAQKDNKDDGLSFGNMLRWLMIAGIVIAIVIFFGGQLLNYSNSD